MGKTDVYPTCFPYFLSKYTLWFLNELFKWDGSYLSVLGCNDAILAATCDFQQRVILTSIDSDEPVQPLFKLRHSK